jgi:hydrogenase maturation protease
MSELNMGKTLVLGIGNSSRGDDALGWKFIDALEKFTILETDYRYQLQIEDASLIRDYQSVVFVDASAEPLDGGFSFSPCEPKNIFYFSTHRIDPSALLWLCEDLYGVKPKAYVLAIEGSRWKLREGLSSKAQKNFSNAVIFFRDWLQENTSKVLV